MVKPKEILDARAVGPANPGRADRCPRAEHMPRTCFKLYFAVILTYMGWRLVPVLNAEPEPDKELNDIVRTLKTFNTCFMDHVAG